MNYLLPALSGQHCDAGQVAGIEAAIGDRICKDDVARLNCQRTVEAIRHCSLKQVRSAEFEASLAAR